MDHPPNSTFPTEKQAWARADALNRETPAGADHHWIVHQAGPEQWEVARVTVTGMQLGHGGRDAVGGHGPVRDPPPILARRSRL